MVTALLKADTGLTGRNTGLEGCTPEDMLVNTLSTVSWYWCEM
jgi:hypothetical protein